MTCLRMIAVFAGFVSLMAPCAALGVDGVLEINQTCAVQTGCFSGDSPGFPVEIDGSAGRSYRLTGDLVVPDPNTTGIFIETHGISIDLNNFTIIGAACVGADSASCRPTSGSGIGIAVVPPYPGTSVRNGSIIGMGSYGVALDHQSKVAGLLFRWNGGDGILIGASSLISENSLLENGGFGMNVSSDSVVSGNVVVHNGDDGINGGSSNLVQGNVVRDNAGYGLNLSASAAYRENVINDNTGGTVTGGIDLGSNSCNGTATCP